MTQPYKLDKAARIALIRAQQATKPAQSAPVDVKAKLAACLRA